jgi:hypothetical protein
MTTPLKRALSLSVPLLVLWAATSFGQTVRYNFDKQTDFSAFKTYRWVVLAGGTKLDDLKDKQIRAAVDAQLTAKGLTKAAGEEADLYVTFQSAIDKEKEFSAYSSGTDWGYGRGWGMGGWYGGGMGGGWTTAQTTTIYVGQVAVDIYDAAQQGLVWRGVVSKTLDVKAKPEKQQKNLDKALTKLFENYPPRAKS